MNSNCIPIFIYKLINKGIKIWIQDKDIKIFVPNNVLFAVEEKNFIKFNKEKIFDCLKYNHVFSKEYSLLILKDNSNEGILSFAQERLWFIERYEAGTNIYNIPLIFRISDHVNLDALQSSIKRIISRHEVLRTIFKEDSEGVVYQLVKDDKEIPLEIRRMEVNGQPALDYELSRELQYQYDLKNEYPIRVCLYKLLNTDKEEANKYYLSIVVHHIAFDGWSIDTFLRELEKYYNYYLNQLKGLESKIDLPELAIQYKDFALWQRNYLSGERLDNQLLYWQNKLSGYETLNLLSDKQRPNWIDYKGASVYFEIDELVSTKLRILAKELNVSLYSLLLAGYFLMLRSYSNQNDLVLGTPVANRHYSHTEDLIGFFVNMLALRIQIDSSVLLREYIQEVGKEVIEAQLHQDLPFEKLVDKLNLVKDTSRHPIFQIVFAIENFENDSHKQKNKEVKQNETGLLEPYVIESNKYDVAKFDISTFIDDSQTCLKGSFNYAKSLFKKKTIIGFLKTYIEILSQFANLANNVQKKEQTKIADLRYLSEKQHHQIVCGWNATKQTYPEDKTIQEVFEGYAKRTPNNIAISCDAVYLTYKDLNERANQLAHHIRQLHKIKPDTLIALCLERNELMVIAMLAVLKTGAAYVPMDPNYPDERLCYIMKDTGAKMILTKEKHKKRLGELFTKEKNLGGKKVNTDEDIAAVVLGIDDNELQMQLSKHPIVNPKTTTSSEHLAYVIYTSGTTGNPKGVMIEHKSVISLVKNVNYVNIDSSDIFIQFSDVAFDAAVFEVWAPLLNGAKLIIPSNEKDWLSDIDYFQKNLIERRVSILWLTKTLFDQIYIINPRIFKSLKYLLIGGEELNKELIYQLKKSYDAPQNIINGYGPTENTTFSCTLNVSKYNLSYRKSIPIGKPLTNRTAYVVNSNLEPLPIGAIGELYVGGEGLARGYLNRPDLTAERFLPNPFQTEEENKKNKNARLYKTGDLVCWLPDGNLEYIGRNDFQVKIRGYRIELGEITSILSSYEGITQSVVLAKEHTEVESSGSKYLIGYYVSKEKLNEEEILNYLASKLPEYMVPNILVHLEKLPLTLNGKLDREALSEPEFLGSDGYIGPRNELEKKICQIWAEVLGLPEDKVGIRNNFFSLGGDSIISIQLVSKLRQKLGLPISIKDIFVYKNVERLYDNVLSKKTSGNAQSSLKTERGILKGEFPLLPIQEWFFENHFPEPNHWNQSFIIKTPTLNLHKLRTSLTKLIKYHDSFRLRYKAVDDLYIQYYDPSARIEELKLLDIRTLKFKKGSRRFAAEMQKILTSWQSNFNLKDGPLYSIGYIHGYSDGSARIFFSFHHLIIDTVSWRILAENLKDLYNGKKLGSKGSSYRQWVSTVKEYAKINADERAYWANTLADYYALDTRLANLVIKGGTRNYANLSLSQEQTKQLLRESNRTYNTQVNDILLTALSHALYDLTGSRVSYIVLEGHGREEINNRIDITGTIGWFTTMFPLRLEVYEDLGKSLKNVKEALRKIPNKGIGYGPLIGYKTNTLPRITFNYLGQLDKEEVSSNSQKHLAKNGMMHNFWNIIDEASGESVHYSNQDQTLINISGLVVNGSLQFSISSMLDEKTTHNLASAFKQKLKNVIMDCLNKSVVEYTMSDFPEYEPYVIFNKANIENKHRLFIFPPGNGGAESYFTNIVPRLQNKELVLFNNYYLYLEGKLGKSYSSHLTYEKLANDYISYIKLIQANGPYNLFGWSFGGVLAFEVARQLMDIGDVVANIVLIDAFFNYKKVATQTKAQVSKFGINYKYLPTLNGKNWNTNLILFKALKVENKLKLKNCESEKLEDLDKIYKHYAEKTTHNNLDDLLPSNNFKTIAMNHDHGSWINDHAQIKEICSNILTN